LIVARTKTEIISDGRTLETETPGLPALVDAVNQVAAADALILKQYPALLRIGRIQAHIASQVLFRIAVLREFDLAKETRDYKDLPYKTESGEVRHVGTLEEYCQAFLGRSYNAIMEDAQNVRLFTESGFTNGLEMGITTAQLRDLRKLPEDSQEIVKLALQANDKDAVLEILQDVIVKNDKKQAEISRRADDAQANYEAQEKVLETKSKLLDQRDHEIEVIKRRIETEPPDETTAELVKAASLVGFRAQHEVRVNLMKAIREIAEQAGGNFSNTIQFVTGLLADIELACIEIREEFPLIANARPDSDPTPDWLRPDYEEKMAEAVANNYGVPRPGVKHG